MLTRKRALRDFQEFRDLVDLTWNAVAVEDDPGKILDEFTHIALGGGSIRHSRNAVFTTIFRLHEIRVDALSDGRRGQESQQTMELRELADVIALALSPRVQLFDINYDTDAISNLIYQWFPVSVESAEKLDLSPENKRLAAALLLALTADFEEWESLSKIYTVSGFRKALRAVEKDPFRV